MKKKIQVSGIEVNLIKKEIKNFHLNVLPPLGKVRVSVPPKVSDDEVKLFVISKLPWIRKQIKKFQSQERESKREFISGESHYFKGDRYILNLIYHNKKPKIEIRNKKYIDFYVKESLSRDEREKVFYNWYRKELKIILPEIIQKWENKIGVKSKSHHVRKMKTKWGACKHEEKKVWFNIDLIKKPISHLEYVVVHELVHLIEKTHNAKFIYHMDLHLPNWRIHKEELNKLMLSYEEWNE